MRVLVVEDEPYIAEAIRDGLRLEAIAADIAGDGDTALELLGINAYDIAVLDRDIPGPSGDEIAESILASGSGMPILMLMICTRRAGAWRAPADRLNRDEQQAAWAILAPTRRPFPPLPGGLAGRRAWAAPRGTRCARRVRFPPA